MKRFCKKYRGHIFVCMGLFFLGMWAEFRHDWLKELGNVCIIPVIEHLFEVSEE